MNKNYDWNETNTGVTITFPLLYKIDKKLFGYINKFRIINIKKWMI